MSTVVARTTVEVYVLDLVIPRPAWLEHAECRGADPRLFYPAAYETVDAAVAVCKRCAVRVECLEWALLHDELGVWGGTSERERRAILRAQRQRARGRSLIG